MDRKGLLGALGAIVMGLVVSWSDAQTSAFSYQGVLTDQSMSADGVYDLRFSLYSSSLRWFSRSLSPAKRSPTRLRTGAAS